MKSDKPTVKFIHIYLKKHLRIAKRFLKQMSNESKETSLIDMKTHYKAMKIKDLVLDHEQRDRSIESNRSFMNRLMLDNI